MEWEWTNIHYADLREMKKVVAVVVVVVLALFLGASSEQLSSRECENLGFTGLALCSDCNTLSEYVKDKGSESDLSLSLSRIQFWFQINFSFWIGFWLGLY